MSKIISKVIVSVFILSTFVSTEGQQNTNSPYSRFGIGDISNNNFGASKALGGLSIGLRYPNQINYLNPASYTSQDTMSFLFDVGITGSHIKYETSTQSSFYSSINIEHMAFSFPVNNWCSMSVGITPYSSVGYKVTDQYYVNGESVVNAYEGFGNTNRFFLGSSFKLLNRISVGFNASYLFGALNYNNTVAFADPITYKLTPGTYVSEEQNKTVIGDFLFDFGLQYFDTISDNLTYTLGFIFNNETNINTKNSVNKEILRDDLVFPYAVDTLAFTENEKGYFSLPRNIGGGFTINFKNRLLFGLDYSMQNWAKTSKSYNNGDSLVNSNSILGGIEYTPNPYVKDSYLKTVHYRVGGYYKNTPLFIEGQQLKNYGITFGLGLPFKHSQSSFNFACDLGQRGTTNNNLIKESYAIWSVSLTFKDLWFYKSKFD